MSIIISSEQLQRAESTTKEVKEQILELRGILFNVNLLQGLMHDVNITVHTNSTEPRGNPRVYKYDQIYLLWSTTPLKCVYSG